MSLRESIITTPISGSHLDSLFVLRHAQRADKVSTTVSSIDFVQKTQHLPSNEYIISDSYNPGLATFQSTNNKSNNGYTQSMEMGQKLLNYVQTHIKESTVILKFHTSPYLRCIQTIKFMIDYIVKKHKDSSKKIKIIIYIDQFLSEWLNSELDINSYPPNDNGEGLLSFAIQYLNSNLNLNSSRNDYIDIKLDLSDSYKFGNPGPYTESFINQYNRVNQGLISLIKDNAMGTPNNITSVDQKEILLVMTHGAIVRSLISKLIGKSLFVEIPLGSMSISKPMSTFTKNKYYWKLLETDIEIRSGITFNEVNVFSHSDPFKDVQLTFSNKASNQQLNFKAERPNILTNSMRYRSQTLLEPKHSLKDESDEDSEDSDNEGLTFNVGRRPNSTISSDDNQKRFRSTSLFGPVLRNPFFSDDEAPSVRRPRKHNNATTTATKNNNTINNNIKNNKPLTLKTPKPVKKTSLTKLHESISPNKFPNDYEYQNIDVDDGRSHSIERVPDLEELSSSNSSSNSLNDSINDLTIFPGSFSTLNSHGHGDSPNSDNSTPIGSSYELSKSNNSSIITLDGDDSNTNIQALTSQSSISNKNNQGNNNSKSSIFDKSLIEKSLSEMLISSTENLNISEDKDDNHDNNNNSVTPTTTNNNNSNNNNNITNEQQKEKKESLSSILQEHEAPDSFNWMMSFGSSSSSSTKKKPEVTTTPAAASNDKKFKIDLYGKKNRFGLNLYDDMDEREEEESYGMFGGGFSNGSSSAWMLGSNKY